VVTGHLGQDRGRRDVCAGGSKEHYEGIAKYGITPLHRKSFLKNLTEKHHDGWLCQFLSTI